MEKQIEKWSCKLRLHFSYRVPGMGNDLVVKVHYGLGSRNR